MSADILEFCKTPLMVLAGVMARKIGGRNVGNGLCIEAHYLSDVRTSSVKV